MRACRIAGVFARPHGARNRIIALKAIIRVDANPRIGGGHVHRCLVLAHALAAKGCEASFVFGAAALETVPALARSPFARHALTEGDEVEQLRAVAGGGCDLLIIDHYERSADFERACRTFAPHILAIDDLADREHACDILLDHSPGRGAGDYAGLLPTNCRVLAGPAYALLDPRFHAARQSLAPRGETVSRIFLSFGSIDNAGASLLALEALAQLKAAVAVDVVIGRHSRHLGAVQKLAAGLSPQALVHVDTDQMPALMSGADVAVGAGGVTSLERCCLGLPSLVVTVADNQRPGTAALANMGALIDLGPLEALTADKLAALLRDFVADARLRRAVGAAAMAVTEGLGAERVRDAVLGA
jgi:UDP-2,4-diacetamido-2,4,6-trideoxy-beta-L-altropyranose hydrolase